MSDIIKVNYETDAILHVDVQTAFMANHAWQGELVKGGGLPVPDGHGILPAVLHADSFFHEVYRYASLDQHPAGHVSFASSYRGLAPYHDLTLEEVKSNGVDIVSSLFDGSDLLRYLEGCPSQKQTLWPDHACLSPSGDSSELELHPALTRRPFQYVVKKGMDPKCDSYSAVADNLGRSTGLGKLMYGNGVRRVFVDGLAYTHCVGWTALGLAARGFEVYLTKDATRSVPIPGLEEAMDDDLVKAGVRIIQSSQLSR